MYYNMLNVGFLQLMSATCHNPTDRKNRPVNEESYARLGIALRKIIMATTKVDLAPEEPFLFIYKT